MEELHVHRDAPDEGYRALRRRLSGRRGRGALLLAAVSLACSAADGAAPLGAAPTSACAVGLAACMGGCVDLAHDVRHCGACGGACLAGQSCVNGACACPAGTSACATGCADLRADGANCGRCGVACTSGQACAEGSCATSCPAGLLQCGSSCVDTATSLAHCGACDHACLPGQSCAAGTCACAGGQQPCAGQCVDTNTSQAHCGSCGNPCATGARCVAGACVGEPPVDTDGGAAGGAGAADPAGTSATFQVDVSLSTKIATVGIVEWSVDVPVDRAVVGFGRQAGAFEYEAPVDLGAPHHRTLLLGMKPRTTYYVQVVAFSGAVEHRSEILPLETGFLPNGLPMLTVNTVNAAGLYGGFTINCTGTAGSTGMDSASASHVFVFDRDGDHVWAYEITGTAVAACSRARMSFDGKSMWVGNFSNVSPDGALLRIAMDGLGDERYYSFPGRHHDFTVLPNGHVLFQEQANGGGYDGGAPFGGEGPDLIKELDPETGVARLVYDERTDFAALIEEANGAHTNYVTYVPHLDAISLSLRHASTIGLISYPAGELIAVFGGSSSDLPLSWDSQHGHQFLEGNRLLLFNNDGSNGGASVLEYAYDLAASTATKIFDYSSGVSAPYFGDVQRLRNGNTFVTYSPVGVFHEVDPAGVLLREITTTTVGYSEHRRTLYGPPPPSGD